MVHWQKILVYSLLLFLLLLLPTTLTTYFFGVPDEYSSVQVWGEYLALAGISFVVFYSLAAFNLTKPFWHALGATVLAFIIASVVLFIISGEFSYTLLSAIENAFTLIGMFLGTYVGLAFTKKRSSNDHLIRD